MKRTLAAIAAIALFSACSSLPEPEGPTAQTPQPAVTTPPPTTPPPQTPPPSTSTPASAGAFDPVGTFTFALDVAGTSASGTIAIAKGQDGKLGGSLNSDQGSLPLNSVAVDGRKMTLGFDFNGTPVSIVMNFDGDKYTGTINVEGMGSGPISGERKKG
jgi:hypothetical protein